jgi:Mrp family chromosome partitioning ATPase
MLDALRRADNVPSANDAARATPSVLTLSGDAEPLLVAAEEIPFIEVGPRKSMEASASVLACAPVAAVLPLSVAPPSPPRGELPSSVAAPRSVYFRALPGRAAPRSSFAAELVAYHAPEQAAAQQYREVLDAVLNASPARDRPTALLFVSALPRSGNTTTLLNIALTAGQQRQRVVVVDANFRRPAVAERLGLSAAPGLREAMAGSIALDEIIRPTELANLFAVTAGVGDNGGVRFVAESLRSLLRQLRQRYPLVFVDGPRWDGRPEVASLGAACDAVFLVTPEQEAETPQTDALLRLIAEQGARLAGCILVAGSSSFL